LDIIEQYRKIFLINNILKIEKIVKLLYNRFIITKKEEKIR